MTIHETASVGAPPFEERTSPPSASEGELRRAAEDAGAAIEELFNVTHLAVSRRVRERPYVALGAAAGVGFVLGGGLSSRISGAILTLWGRVFLARALENWGADAVPDEQKH